MEVSYFSSRMNSLIIPAYNEAPVIAATLRDLRSAFTEQFGDDGWEIIVVDNASTDGTAAASHALRDSRIRVIELPMKGKGHATRAGFALARGEYVGFTDADLSVPPNEVAQAFIDIKQSGANILIGSRFHKDSSMPEREWWRIFTSQLFNRYARIMLGVPFFDTQCPLKIVDKDGRAMLLITNELTWFFDLEFLALAHRASLFVAETPVTWNEHRYPERRSKLSTTRDGVRYLFAMPRIKKRLPAQLALWSAANNNRVGYMTR